MVTNGRRTRDERTGAIREAHKRSPLEGFAIPFAAMMLLAMIVMASASPMAGAVAEGKMQRVFEMLIRQATGRRHRRG